MTEQMTDYPDETLLTDVPLTTRAANILMNVLKLRTVADVRRKTDRELLQESNFGRVSLAHVRKLTGRGKDMSEMKLTAEEWKQMRDAPIETEHYIPHPPLLVNPMPTPMDILSQAVKGGASLETIEKLMELSERWERNIARKAYDAAIAAARAEIPTIVKNRTINRGGNAGSWKYEDLASIDEAIREPLAKNGLSFRFRTAAADKGVMITCIVSHRDGHSEETSLPGPADLSGGKNPIQGIGSAVTYLCRYTLKAALGLAAASDDDAQSVGQPQKSAVSEDELNFVRGRLKHLGIEEAALCEVLEIAQLGDMTPAKLREGNRHMDEYSRWRDKQ